MSETVRSASPSRFAAGPLRRPELLAPAGDWECARAAVENGADAIYFGLERFNARMRARNFTQADLPALMEFLHRRGVRGYVTFNTLVFADEVEAARDYLRTIISAGVDAAIVQDVGICRLIRRLSPDFPIHVSTQMTVTSAAGIDFARDLGAQLVVLARENSLADIEQIQVAQSASEKPSMPLEVFVHGALCVAYSGQCLTSESLGGRSANRGECAQACRLPYDLVSDGKKVDLGDRRYLLSPQDLAGIDVLPDLVQRGVASLKIEGRLKSAEYVASITRVYRQALDRVLGAVPSVVNDPGPVATPAERYELEMSFSRGLYTGWFRGINNQELAHGRFGTKRGVFLGQVTRVLHDAVAVALIAPLKPGDGVVFDAGNPEQREEGGRAYSVDGQGSESILRFGRGDINFARIRPGHRLWKTNDPELDRRVRQTFQGEKVRFQRPLSIEVHGHAGAPLTLVFKDTEGHIAQQQSAQPLLEAKTQPLTPDRLREQLGRLGGTPFRLGNLEYSLEGNAILPLSELNRLRREGLAELERQRSTPKRWQLNGSAKCTVDAIPAGPIPSAAPAELILLVRNLEQLDAALTCRAVETVYCEFENPKRYRDAVEHFRTDAARRPSEEAAKRSIWVAPPRISKPGEEWILKQVRSCDADGYLVRNYDHLRFFSNDRKRGDFSLNVANPLTAELFLRRHGLERVTASYDLNISQLEALLRRAPGDWFEITVHQHMPMFHMEHCVFCAFLSTGRDYRDCGRPCEAHDVRLRDRVGAELPLKADAGCRNTVYNNRAQTGAEYVGRLRTLGARAFRVEFVNENADEVVQTASRYLAVIRGEVDGTSLWRELKLLNQLGVTRGQMEATPQIILKKGS
ncbi:peptidase U32 [Opitutaceae bacterium EW11]|nr:peptidase U32 [Opitutaceae bacterium EW11]